MGMGKFTIRPVAEIWNEVFELSKIEPSTKIVTSKSIKKSNSGFSIFDDIKENSKKPKYNYHSGLTAGMLLRDFSIVMTLKKECPTNMLETVSGLAKLLIEEHNWKKKDLYQLLEQCFGENGNWIPTKS